DADLTALSLYLVEEYAERDETLFRSIRAIPPGTSITVARGEIRQRLYYRPDPWKRLFFRRSEDYAAHLRSTLRDAVRSRMRARGRIGCQLSGGLDSSSVSIEVELAHRDRVIAEPAIYLHAEFPGF